MTDFDLIQSKVQAMFEKTNVAGEIVILQKLKRLFEEKQASSSEESKHVDLPAIMEQIESLVKTEAKKGSTVDTITKLIQYSRTQNSCYLCKQGLTAELSQKMV